MAALYEFHEVLVILHPVQTSNRPLASRKRPGRAIGSLQVSIWTSVRSSQLRSPVSIFRFSRGARDARAQRLRPFGARLVLILPGLRPRGSQLIAPARLANSYQGPAGT